MKITQETINILKYFSTINPGIVITPGSIISTMTPNKNIVAAATVIEDFTQEFGIYNLSEFLNIISILKEPTLKFINSKQAEIVDGSINIKYTFAEPLLMTKAPKKLTQQDVIETFELTTETLSMLQKAVSILNLQDIIFEGDGSKVYIRGIDLKQSSSSSFNYELGDTNKTFKAIIKVDFLKIMSGTYNVNVTEKFCEFKHIEKSLTTWIGLDERSRF